MALCLAHPQYGYYMTRDPLGLEGDFVTAPEISQMFGELIGLWAAQAWLDRGAPRSLSADRARAGAWHPDGGRAARRTRGAGLSRSAERRSGRDQSGSRGQAEARARRRPRRLAIGTPRSTRCLTARPSSSPTNSSTPCRCASSCAMTAPGASVSSGLRRTARCVSASRRSRIARSR